MDLVASVVTLLNFFEISTLPGCLLQDDIWVHYLAAENFGAKLVTI